MGSCEVEPLRFLVLPLIKECDDTEVDIGLKSGQLNRLKVFPWPSCLKFSANSEDIFAG